jgi:hypothetical protein
MAITLAKYIVQPRIDGSPGILTGVGAPVAEVYDTGTIYNRSDAVGQYVSNGAGVWTQILDTASVILNGALFTGTGYATVGQVTTTTDSQTMTLNQCAGMWLITATKAPSLITGNTAVTGAPAVLTVYGAAPATTAETYRILRMAITP